MGIAAIVLGVGLLGVAGIWWARRRRGRDEAPRSGEVRMVDPRDLLFSLPTIADAVPPTEPATRPGDEPNAAVVDEDDWRQVEFVSSANGAFVERQLTELRAHKERHRVGLGFREIFVRPEPPASLAETGLTVAELARELGAAASKPVFLRGAGSVLPARGGFAVEIPELGFLYGTEHAGSVYTLGLRLVGSRPELGDIAGLVRLSERFDVFLVDWLRQERVPSRDPARLRAWIATALTTTRRPQPTEG